MARLFIPHGADPNERYWYGGTAVMATEDGKTVDVLVEHGAKLNLEREPGESLFMHDKRPEFYDALIRHGVPFDPKKEGASALIWASANGNVPLAESMLARGADPNLPGVMDINDGKPEIKIPIEMAVEDGHPDVVECWSSMGRK